MFNPLLDDLTQLKDQDLEAKMTDLNKKYTIALRTGNGSLAMQVAMIIEAVRDETLRRQSEATKKMLAKQNKDLDGLINIG
jgi:acyl-CoA hydrolase